MRLSFIPGLARRGALRPQIEAVDIHHAYRGRGLGAAMFGLADRGSQRRRCALVQHGDEDLAPAVSKLPAGDLAAGARPSPRAPRRAWCLTWRTSTPSAGLTPWAPRAEPAAPAVSERAALPSGRGFCGVDQTGRDGRRGQTTCKCGNSRCQEWPCRRARW